MLIDSHCHLTSEELFPDIDGIMARAKAADVGAIVNICTSLDNLEAGISLTERYKQIYLAAAVHPHDVQEEEDLYSQEIERLSKEKKLVAIGETGLDYFYEHGPKELQKKWLEKYFQLAAQTGLPLIFHCREAFEDLFSIANGYPQASAVLHCFSGTVDEAREVVDRGWLVSISGIVTFKKSETIREAAKFVPLDRLLIETDAPYLAPQSKRGKRNEPSYLPETAMMIAQVKGISFEEVAHQTSKNATQFFGLRL